MKTIVLKHTKTRPRNVKNNEKDNVDGINALLCRRNLFYLSATRGTADNYFIIPPLRHFTILGQKNPQNMPRYYIVEQGKNTD